MEHLRVVESLARRIQIRRPQRENPRAARWFSRCQECDRGICHNKRACLSRERSDMRRDVAHAKLEEEPDALCHRAEVHKIERHDFEATRIVEPAGVVVEKRPKIGGRGLRHPANFRRLQLRDEFWTHVAKARAPR